MEELYLAQLDGFALEIESIDDSFEKSIARHEFPNRDGALLEDLGQKARTVNFRCYFWDHGKHLTYGNHIKFVNHLSSQALFELIHPTYGIMLGMVERVTVRHDDRNWTAEVDVTFVENMREPIDETRYQDVEAATEEAFIAGQEEQQDELADDLADEGLPLDQELVAEQSILSQVKATAQSSREMAREMDGYLNFAATIAADVTDLEGSLVSVVNYGVNLPGRVIGVLARVVERTARSYSAIKTAPARLMKSLKLAFQNLENQFANFSLGKSKSAIATRDLMIKHLRLACAQRLALEAAYAYSADEQLRQQVRRSEQTQSFDLNGNYVGTPTETVLNARELDESLADARDLLQAALDQARGMRSLKAMAISLLDHVNVVKLERDRIVSITLESPRPLHLVCLMYGLPYQMAERIASINDIPNPNFTSGSIDIYVR